jgi:histone deacetylase 6
MLDEHEEEVEALLLAKRTLYDETDKDSQFADDDRQGLRSPPLPIGSRRSRMNSVEARSTASSTPLKSPKMPPMGLFNVNSPKSPRSPMKRNF